MKKFIRLAFIIYILFAANSQAQIIIDGSLSDYPEILLRDHFFGEGIIVQNINYVGSPYWDRPSIGLFNGVNTNIGLDSGIILATGSIYGARGPNNMPWWGDSLMTVGDYDLDYLSLYPTKDAAVIEFEFYPKYKKVSFQYVFASEEYEEYVGSEFNDVFGFFISGPGIKGKQNIARIPESNEIVSINTVHNGCWEFWGEKCQNQVKPRNPEYFIKNIEDYVQYDGFTVVLTASMENLTPGEKYYIKIAIADVADNFYDSGVFLKAGSFSSKPDIYFDSNCFGDSTSFVADLGYPVENYFWDFGDGDTSTLESPVHYYGAPGVYDVKLTTTFVDTNYVEHIEKKVKIVEVKADFSFTFHKSIQYRIDFNDISATNDSEIESWEWDFGDGKTSELQNPSHTYPGPGVYWVELIVTTYYGCVDTVRKKVRNYDSPIEYTGLCVGEPFYFSIDQQGNIESFFWHFGDGVSKAGANPQHIYSEPGFYNVSCELTYAGDVRDTVELTVEVIGPIANFLYYIGAGDKPTVDFKDNSSIESGTINSWEWDFGDGAISYEQNPVHQYQDNGEYEVTLIVGTEEGCKDTISKRIEMIANKIIYYGYCFGREAEFNFSTTWRQVEVLWDFGDGTNSSYTSPTHLYASPGKYNISLIVANKENEDTDTVSLAITISEPIADYYYTTGSGANPNIYFEDKSLVNFGTIYSWGWDFGDGASSNEQNPEHQYASPGVYTVQLVITDLNNCRDTIVKTIDINQLANEIVASGHCAGEGVEFAVKSFWDISAFKWNFGDGTSSVEEAPTHIYKSGGLYEVELIIENSKNSQLDTLKYDIAISEPIADFSFIIGGGAAPNVDFQNQSSIINGNIISYAWEFGDGGSSKLENPSHRYSAKGYYDVKLIATSENGCKDSITKEVNTFVNEIIAADGCVNIPVDFDLTSSWNLGALSWDFDDGSSSNQNAPSHIYNTGGQYIVRLIAENSDNEGLDTVNKLITIAEPHADYDYNLTVGANPLVDYTDKSTVEFGNIISWEWEFGDGNSSNEQNPSRQYDFSKAINVLLEVTTENGCIDTISKRIFLYGSANAVISAPDTCVMTGDIFIIDLELSTSENLDNSENYNYEGKLRFNKTVLLPYDNTNTYEFDGPDCIVSFSGRRIPEEQILQKFKVIALLGEYDKIDIEIDEFNWTDGEITPTELVDGSVCILNICPAGGKRLYNPTGAVNIIGVAPNPANEYADIEFEVVADGSAELFISNILGEKSISIHNGQISPGKYSIRVNTAELASGQYIITLRTLSAIKTKRMEVVK